VLQRKKLFQRTSIGCKAATGRNIKAETREKGQHRRGECHGKRRSAGSSQLKKKNKDILREQQKGRGEGHGKRWAFEKMQRSTRYQEDFGLSEKPK
jgi:hypothetical protein